MVRIRFRRVGARNQPSFRIVAADKESPRDGRFLENLGHYNPRTEPSTVVVDEARLFHWLQHGAQPSDSVRQALNPIGTWDRWERFKAGEDLDTLLAEAEASKVEVDPRTRRDDLFGERSAKKAAAKKAKTAEEEVVEEKAAAVEEVPEEEPVEVAVEEDEVAEGTEAPSEPEPEEDEQEPAETSEETAEDDKPDEDEATPAKDAEVDASEEETQEPSEEEEPESSED